MAGPVEGRLGVSAGGGGQGTAGLGLTPPGCAVGLGSTVPMAGWGSHRAAVPLSPRAETPAPHLRCLSPPVAPGTAPRAARGTGDDRRRTGVCTRATSALLPCPGSGSAAGPCRCPTPRAQPRGGDQPPCGASTGLAVLPQLQPLCPTPSQALKGTIVLLPRQPQPWCPCPSSPAGQGAVMGRGGVTNRKGEYLGRTRHKAKVTQRDTVTCQHGVTCRAMVTEGCGDTG